MAIYSQTSLLRIVWLGLVFTIAANQAEASLINIPGLSTIRIWESTGPYVPYDFAATGPELNSRHGLAGLVAGNNDFSTSAGESYDVFFSDANGNLDPNGCFVTVEADYPVVTPQPGGGGLNLAAVDLIGSSGLIARADLLASWYGRGSNYIPGSEAFAVDPDTPTPTTDTTMGNTAPGPIPLLVPLRVTVGFTGLCIPEPATLTLIIFGLIGIVVGNRH